MRFFAFDLNTDTDTTDAGGSEADLEDALRALGFTVADMRRLPRPGSCSPPIDKPSTLDSYTVEVEITVLIRRCSNAAGPVVRCRSGCVRSR
jgi:hypothetical protein